MKSGNSFIRLALVALIIASVVPAAISQTDTTTTRPVPPPSPDRPPGGPGAPQREPSAYPSSVAVKVGDCSITISIERQAAARAEGATTAPAPPTSIKEVEIIKKVIVCVVSADPLRLSESVIVDMITCTRAPDYTSIDCSGPTRILPK